MKYFLIILLMPLLLTASEEKIKSLGLNIHTGKGFVINNSNIFITPSYDEEEELPQVDAGEDISICIGSLVVLDGSNTYDPLERQISYEWFFYSKPIGSNCSIWNYNSINPSFIPDKAGEYYLTLKVTTEDGRIGSDTVTISAKDCTSTPIVSLKMNTTGTVDEMVEVAADINVVGENSDVMQYSWSLIRPNGSKTTLSRNVGLENSFLPDVSGKYTVRLKVVTNNGYQSEWSTASIWIYEALPPDISIFGETYKIGGLYLSGNYVKLDIVVEHLSGKRISKVILYRKQGDKDAEYVTAFVADEENGSAVIKFSFNEELMSEDDLVYMVVGYCDAEPIVTRTLFLKGEN